MFSYGLIGSPLDHSYSPALYAVFAKWHNVSFAYRPLPCRANTAAATLLRFQAEGGMGVNVTQPLKQWAADWATVLTSTAQAAGSVNVLDWHSDGCVSGHNTDGLGFMRAVSAQAVGGDIWHGARVLLLGAGGAAAGLALLLAQQGIAQLCIANRTLARAQALASRVIQNIPTAHCITSALSALATAAPFDIVINATSPWQGHVQTALPIRCQAHTHVYDLNYGLAAQPFLSWAKQQGALHVQDGWAMLVHQAALTFERWTGCALNPAQLATYIETCAP